MAHPTQKQKSVNIVFQLENQTLARLIGEQLSALGNTVNEPDLPADCLITDEGSKHKDKPSIPVLEIAKGRVILGNLLDQLKYILSGRESHVEDENESIDLDSFTLHPARNTLTHKESGLVIHLTDKERLLLRFLYQAGAAGLPRPDLLKSVWGYAEAAETHTLETHIYRLRQKLEPFNAQDMIKAADGYYMLVTKNPPD